SAAATSINCAGGKEMKLWCAKYTRSITEPSGRAAAPPAISAPTARREAPFMVAGATPSRFFPGSCRNKGRTPTISHRGARNADRDDGGHHRQSQSARPFERVVRQGTDDDGAQAQCYHGVQGHEQR